MAMCTTDGLTRSSFGSRLHRFWFSGWGFDALYDRLLEKPYIRLAQVNRNDWFDRIVDAVAYLTRKGYRGLSATQSGLLRAYAMGIAGGAILIIGMVVFL